MLSRAKNYMALYCCATHKSTRTALCTTFNKRLGCRWQTTSQRHFTLYNAPFWKYSPSQRTV